MEMTIYGAKAPWPFLKGLIRENRPVWFFEEVGLPYKRVSLDPMKGENKSPAYTQLNRFQKVPTLEYDGFSLAQSAAILHHLAVKTGRLYPKTPEDQARLLEWMFFAMSDVEPHAVQLGVLMHMVDEKDHDHAQWMLKRAEMLLTRALNYLEGELEGREFLMGSEFNVADILLGCCLYPIRDHQLVQDRPRIKRLLATYMARPAFQRAIEVNGT